MAADSRARRAFVGPVVAAGALLVAVVVTPSGATVAPAVTVPPVVAPVSPVTPVAPVAPAAGGASAATARPALRAFRVAAAPTDEQLVVSWQYASGAPVTRLHLDLYQYVGSRAVEVGSTIVGNTVEPDLYTVPVPPGRWTVRATPENAAGFGAGITAPAVVVAASCHTATVCVDVASPTRAQHIRLAGEGFLHGTSAWSSSRVAAQLAPLAPRQMRVAGSAAGATAKRVRASTTQVLSDLWTQATARSNWGYARTPWSNWSAWSQFVKATVRAADQQGWAPAYWDVWNEPNGTCCPRFSNADLPSVTVARWLQTYVIAWRAIRSVDPHARIIGPSLSALQWAPGSPHEFDLDTFLSYSATHRVKWSAISWHENTTAPSPGDIASSVTNLDRHVAMARAVMARHPGTVDNNAIFVNEYAPANVHTLAGWAVGYFRAFEDDGVSQANLACWSAAECTNDLDGLFTAAAAPTAVWWAHRDYALLAGDPALAVRSSSSWQLDGLAARDDAHHSVRVLLGRHYSCNQPVNPWCGYDAHIAPASLSITLPWPYGNTPVTVTTQRLPAGTGALAAPLTIGSTTVRPANGRLTVRVASVADGDAISLVARRV